MVKKSLITSHRDYAQASKATAQASYSGWGATAQANFAQEKESSYNARSVKLMDSRRIDMGYEGWATTFPPFNDFAKKVMR